MITDAVKVDKIILAWQLDACSSPIENRWQRLEAISLQDGPTGVLITFATQSALQSFLNDYKLQPQNHLLQQSGILTENNLKVFVDLPQMGQYLHNRHLMRKNTVCGSTIYRDGYNNKKQDFLLNNLSGLLRNIAPDLQLSRDVVGVRLLANRQPVTKMPVLQQDRESITSKGFPSITEQDISACCQTHYYTSLPVSLVEIIQDKIFCHHPSEEQGYVQQEHCKLYQGLVEKPEHTDLYQALASIVKAQKNHFLYQNPLHPSLGMVKSLGEQTAFLEIALSGPRPYPEASAAWYIEGDAVLSATKIQINFTLYHNLGQLLFAAVDDQVTGNAVLFVNRYSLGSHLKYIEHNVKIAFRQLRGPLPCINPITGASVLVHDEDTLYQLFLQSISVGLIMALALRGDKIKSLYTDFMESITKMSALVAEVKQTIAAGIGYFSDFTEERKTQAIANVAKIIDTGTEDLIQLAAEHKFAHPEDEVVVAVSASAATTAGYAKGQYFSGTGCRDNRSEEVAALVSLGGILPPQLERRQSMTRVASIFCPNVVRKFSPVMMRRAR